MKRAGFVLITLSVFIVSCPSGGGSPAEHLGPIAITFSGQQSQLPPGTDMTITATTSENPVTYQWYLGGVPLTGQTSSSITIGSSLTPGNYKLDLEVTKGSVISSESITFSVLSSPQAVLQTNLTQTGTKLNIYFYGGTQWTDAKHGLYTIWAEDVNGTYMQDLFVCSAVATNVYPYSGAWVARPQSVPYWAHKACILDPYGHVGNLNYNSAGMYLALPTADAMGGPSIPSDIDAVSGATKRVNFELQTRKNDMNPQFRVMLEVNLPWDTNVYYADGTVGQPSLVYGAVVDTNSSQRFYTMTLLGAGNVSGSDGALYDTSHCTTALDIAKTIIVYLAP